MVRTQQLTKNLSHVVNNFVTSDLSPLIRTQIADVTRENSSLTTTTTTTTRVLTLTTITVTSGEAGGIQKPQSVQQEYYTVGNFCGRTNHCREKITDAILVSTFQCMNQTALNCIELLVRVLLLVSTHAQSACVGQYSR